MSEVNQVPDSSGPAELVTAANQTEAVEQVTATEGDTQQEQEEAKPAKTFSQEEVDALIAKRIAKEARKQGRIEAEAAALREQLQKLTPPEPKRDAFATDEEHEQARIQHAIREEARKLAAEQVKQLSEQQKQQTAVQSFWSKADEVGERFPDFEQAVTDPTFVQLSGHIYEFVMDSDIGPELAYHLSKNRQKAVAIHGMSPIQAARALMTLESEIKSKPKAKPSNAPEPINPVGNRGRATASALPSDTDDIDTWMRKERARTQRK
jgi:hypothetical protein